MATPFENSDKNALYLTLFDIDSFLRLQQLILRGMIYTDKTRDVCPFCGNPLIYAEGHVECLICRTQIFDRVCPETGKNYIETGIKEFVLKKGGLDETSKRDKFYADKITEARLHYRNITPLSQSGKAVCPHCNKTH